MGKDYITFLLIDHQGSIIYASPSAEKLFQYGEKELEKRSISELFPEIERWPVQGVKKDGSEETFEIEVVPFDYEGQKLKVINISRKEDDNLLHRLVEGSLIAMSIVDADGIMVFVNQHMAHLFGYAPDEMIGETVEMLLPEEVRIQHVRQRKKYMEHPNTREMGVGRDLYGIHRSGALIPIEIGLNPITIQGKQYVISYILNISERKRQEAKMSELFGYLKQANADLEMFTLAAADDLQKPLRKIDSFGKLLEEDYASSLDKEAHLYIEEMRRAAQEMRSLIQDLREFSLISTKDDPYITVNLTHVIEEVIQSLKGEIEKKKATIQVAPLENIFADEKLIYTLFHALILNAITFHKYNHPPVVSIKGDLRKHSYHIEIQDNGIGIKEEFFEKVFLLYQRLHSKEEFPGRGIGLSLAKRIILKHRGSISIESTEGEGTTIHLDFPIDPKT